jgi:ferrous iron transport protein B
VHDHNPDINLINSSKESIAIVGNPNVGKSVIFRHLTGKYATVSNYPGTTVEITTGFLKNGMDNKMLVLDTPGTNSLIPASDDERITKRILLEGKHDLIIHVGDMKNLRRTLHLTHQILTLIHSTPVILVLNMEDEAKKKGIKIDIKMLSQKLGIPVISTIATRKKDIDKIFDEINKINGQKISNKGIKEKFSKEIEDRKTEIAHLLKNKYKNPRGMAEMLLRGDQELVVALHSSLPPSSFEKISNYLDFNKTQFTGNTVVEITKEIDNEINKIITDHSRKEKNHKKTLTEYIDDLCLNPITGIPILLLILYSVFLFVGIVGAGTLVDYFESYIFGEIINPIIIDFVNTWIPIPIVEIILIGEYGIVTFGLTYAIAIVFPVVTAFFIMFAILEDSGYLPRLAFLVDRLFRAVGLNGKAVLPLILGTGCGTMATMTTRILETRKERIIATTAIALGIPCSAQLAVIFGMLTYISPVGMMVVFGVVFGQLLLVTFLISKFIPGEKSDFIIELPPLRIPTSNVLVKTWGRVEWFLKEAIPLFILGTLFISFLNLFTLIEIILYTFGFVSIFFIINNTFFSLKKTYSFLDKKGVQIMSYTIVSSIFLVGFFSTGIPTSVTQVIAGLAPYSQMISEIHFLELILEISKPIVVVLLGLPPESTIMYILGFLRRDYGAAGFFEMATTGLINSNQIVVGTIVLTLFIPCVANLFVIMKEYGYKTGLLMVSFIIPLAVITGAFVHLLLLIGRVSL